ncbi:hypothetical protein YYC_04245 [Plasmodium yoelii 17X]|uniref:Uncharacterized protein n=4 Tax=Plasmodium yoelii TaxID=5861 RepID=Q7R9U4_PLAYO|nr:conserved protein, unknown function [Plasmodium yoelii]EAA19050.1 hypothetical protein [Plasmodium yoelii yoelii]ETB58179.1 hypothetical protein YYC_04245 [Plasmodium yoelii 17X]WBY59124.1 hypothetical protein Py17XNL_001204998 [Plasmodium yoelii yoelii]CDU19297.1 conserved Plasmodium protein, unknown function [Plasmodium yoelii]VTZ79932.1 conserved protein, unknown function [Plasmodium yoelii]|eukprot:XP_727485.1 conserved protein, unknown function [Plasmodium yoelii]
MGRLGKMSNCCCLPLGGGCILSTVIIFVRFLGLFAEKNTTARTINLVLYAVLCCFAILGILFKNFIIFYIVTGLIIIHIVDIIISFILILVAYISLSNNYNLTSIVILLVTLSTSMVIMFMLLNVFLSTANVLKEGGTGWENKNYKQIRAEKNAIISKEEKKIVDNQTEQNDYKA